MITNPREFYRLITYSIDNSHNDDLNYWNVPIFQNIAPDRFFTIYKKIPNINKHWINDTFKERYKFINHHPHLKVDFLEFSGELDFMKNFLKLVDHAITSASSFTPSIWHLKHLKDEGLKFAIEELEKCVKPQGAIPDGET